MSHDGVEIEYPFATACADDPGALHYQATTGQRL
jgi:hypothetical protein